MLHGLVVVFAAQHTNVTIILVAHPSHLTARARLIPLSQQQQGLPSAAEEAFAGQSWVQAIRRRVERTGLSQLCGVEGPTSGSGTSGRRLDQEGKLGAGLDCCGTLAPTPVGRSRLILGISVVAKRARCGEVSAWTFSSA